MPVKAVEQAADELYGLPLSDFTKARDEIARRLRKEGKRDEAEAVKMLRKPTAAAWALNQIARQRPQDVQRLLSAGQQLRKAHEALLAGGNRAALQKASAQERELIDALTRDATAVAGEAGTASTAALDERIRNTLHAAALDEDTAAELAAGRLVHDREAVGMFGAGDAESAAPRKARKGAAKREADTGSRDHERALAAARSDERKAQREYATAVKAAERARNRAAEAEQRAEDARAGLREAERREQDTAKAHQQAARAVKKLS